MDYRKEISRALLEIGAVGFKPKEPLTFKSGIISPVYVDNRIFPAHPEKFKLVIEGFENLVKEKNIEFNNTDSSYFDKYTFSGNRSCIPREDASHRWVQRITERSPNSRQRRRHHLPIHPNPSDSLLITTPSNQSPTKQP